MTIFRRQVTATECDLTAQHWAFRPFLRSHRWRVVDEKDEESVTWKRKHRFLFGESLVYWFPLAEYSSGVALGIAMGMESTQRCVAKNFFLVVVFTAVVVVHIVVSPLATVVGHLLALVINFVTDGSVVSLIVAIYMPEYDEQILSGFQYANVITLGCTTLQQLIGLIALLRDAFLVKKRDPSPDSVPAAVNQIPLVERESDPMTHSSNQIMPSTSVSDRLAKLFNKVRMAVRLSKLSKPTAVAPNCKETHMDDIDREVEMDPLYMSMLSSWLWHDDAQGDASLLQQFSETKVETSARISIHDLQSYYVDSNLAPTLAEKTPKRKGGKRTI